MKVLLFVLLFCTNVFAVTGDSFRYEVKGMVSRVGEAVKVGTVTARSPEVVTSSTTYGVVQLVSVSTGKYDVYYTPTYDFAGMPLPEADYIHIGDSYFKVNGVYPVNKSAKVLVSIFDASFPYPSPTNFKLNVLTGSISRYKTGSSTVLATTYRKVATMTATNPSFDEVGYYDWQLVQNATNPTLWNVMAKPKSTLPVGGPQREMCVTVWDQVNSTIDGPPLNEIGTFCLNIL
jgi:hypothetical protein